MPAVASWPTPARVPFQYEDATADFAATLNDPNRWLIKRGVPIFKSHQRTDPNTGKPIVVDEQKLQRIAANMAQAEQFNGVPIRITLGHTEPGKPETQQPPVCGYYRNPRVQPFGPNAEPAIVCDEWLDPQYKSVRKNYPYRSAEYYDDTEQITGAALLTRDPYLDLGIVAYADGKSHSAPPVRQPTLYHYVTRDEPVYPPTAGHNPNVSPAQPVGTQYVTDYPPPQYAPPQQYGQYPQPTPYRSWPGPQHRPPTMHRNHPQSGAVYAAPPGMPPQGDPMGGGGPPGMGGQPGGGGIEEIKQMLDMILQLLTSLPQEAGGAGVPGGMGGAPQSPMGGPAGGGMPPANASRYGQQQPRRQSRPPAPQQQYGTYRYAQPRRPAGYSAATPNPGEPVYPPSYYGRRPVPYGRPAPTTISGMPVGYQLQVDKLNYQLQEQGRALQLMYQRMDAADTEACAAEIRRLAQAGYQVGDFEFQELKKKSPQDRQVYLQHVVTHYQKVPTDLPPPMHGDPTPVYESQQVGPATQEEMMEALRISANDPSPTAYSRALAQVRGQGSPTQYGHNRLASFNGPPDPNAVAHAMGGYMANGQVG